MALKDQLEINGFVCFALYSASRAMTQLYRCYLDELDLTYPQFLTLFLLWQRDGRSVRELTEPLLLDTGTVTPLLKRMESKKLIRRVRSADDERVVQVFLTDRGAALEEQLGPVAGGMLCDIEMTAEDAGVLAERLHALRKTITASVTKRSPDAGNE